MNAPISKAEQIAILNDQFRQEILVFQRSRVPGRVLFTSGIASLDPKALGKVIVKVRTFNTFDEGDNPYGERDFGAFDHPEAGKIFWKIDYYEDQKCEYGSEHPEDPARSFRVLTIMLASEY